MDATTRNPPPSQTAAGGNPGAAQQSKPGPPPDALQIALQRARSGDATVLPQLRTILDENPEIWANCYQLTAMTEQGWLDRIAGTDLLLSQSMRRQVEQLKAEVAGPSPAPIEKLLAERIAISWLAVQHAELSEACGEAVGVKLAQLRLKRLESAHRRLLTATKTLAVVRRLTNGLKVEIRHSHDAAPVQGTTGAKGQRSGKPDADDPDATGSGAADPVRERLRGMFSERDGVDKDAASLVNECR